MANIGAEVVGNPDQPTGVNLFDVYEQIGLVVAGQPSEPVGLSTYTSLTNRDRAPYTVHKNALLKGAKFVAKGPGSLLLVGAEDAQRVCLVDPTDPRSIQVMSHPNGAPAVTERLPGKVKALSSNAEHFFIYLLDNGHRYVQVRKNDSTLAIVFETEVEGTFDEQSAWLALQERADVFAYPAKVGKIEVRRASAPFDLVGEAAMTTGRTVAGAWFRFRAQERGRVASIGKINEERYYLYAIPDRGQEASVFEFLITDANPDPFVNVTVAGQPPLPEGLILFPNLSISGDMLGPAAEASGEIANTQNLLLSGDAEAPAAVTSGSIMNEPNELEITGNSEAHAAVTSGTVEVVPVLEITGNMVTAKAVATGSVDNEIPIFNIGGNMMAAPAQATGAMTNVQNVVITGGAEAPAAQTTGSLGNVPPNFNISGDAEASKALATGGITNVQNIEITGNSEAPAAVATGAVSNPPTEPLIHFDSSVTSTIHTVAGTGLEGRINTWDSIGTLAGYYGIASTGTGPYFFPSGINGQPTVNSRRDYNPLSSGGAAVPDVYMPFAVYFAGIVWRDGIISSDGARLWRFGNPSTEVALRFVANGDPGTDGVPLTLVTGTYDYSVQTPKVPFGEPVLIKALYDGANSYIELDGLWTASTPIPVEHLFQASGKVYAWFLAEANNMRTWEGELRFYDFEPDAALDATIKDELRTKWGTLPPLPMADLALWLDPTDATPVTGGYSFLNKAPASASYGSDTELIATSLTKQASSGVGSFIHRPWGEGTVLPAVAASTAGWTSALTDWTNYGNPGAEIVTWTRYSVLGVDSLSNLGGSIGAYDQTDTNIQGYVYSGGYQPGIRQGATWYYANGIGNGTELSWDFPPRIMSTHVQSGEQRMAVNGTVFASDTKTLVTQLEYDGWPTSLTQGPSVLEGQAAGFLLGDTLVFFRYIAPGSADDIAIRNYLATKYGLAAQFQIPSAYVYDSVSPTTLLDPATHLMSVEPTGEAVFANSTGVLPSGIRNFIGSGGHARQYLQDAMTPRYFEMDTGTGVSGTLNIGVTFAKDPITTGDDLNSTTYSMFNASGNGNGQIMGCLVDEDPGDSTRWRIQTYQNGVLSGTTKYAVKATVNDGVVGDGSARPLLRIGTSASSDGVALNINGPFSHLPVGAVAWGS